jgi:hypothetical protein
MLIATYTSCTTISEKQIEIGIDPNTQKKLVIKAYHFEENKNGNQCDLAVFAQEKNLLFFANIDNQPFCLPISHIISMASIFETTIDPTADESNIDQQPASKQLSTSALITLKAKISPELQIFKSLSILLAKGNIKTLTTFANTCSFNTLIDIVTTAIISQGLYYIQVDDKDGLTKILEAKKALAAPVTFTGEITFIPAELLLNNLNESLTEDKKTRE